MSDPYNEKDLSFKPPKNADEMVYNNTRYEAASSPV